jgi:hypothetical protein
LGEVGHAECIWWHYYYVLEQGEPVFRWETPYESRPEHVIQEGYACPACRAEIQASLDKGEAF